MASSFPGAIDNFTDPLAASPLNSPSHAVQHQDLNDAVEKIETYMGLVKVIPTSVSSVGGTAATLSADGTVNVGTGNTSVTVNGAFSALYTDYRIIMSGGVQSNTVTINLQLGSSTTGYYAFMPYGAVTASTPLGAAANNTAAMPWVGGGLANQHSHVSVELFGPNLARYTKIRNGMYQDGDNYGTMQGEHRVATAYTSFTLSPGTGTITGGTIRVYGYRN